MPFVGRAFQPDSSVVSATVIGVGQECPTCADACRLGRGLAMLLACALLLGIAASAHAGERPTAGPFVFVYGLQGPGAPQKASALGCNTIYLDLPPDAPAQLAALRALIDEAGDAGLRVIVGLRTKLDGAHTLSATNTEYREALRKWLEVVIGGLREAPGVVGWATDHYLERDLKPSSAGFRDFLVARHGSLQGINAFWGASYRSLGQINKASARALDDEQPFGVGRPSIDAAEYERCAFRDVMQLWADEIRRLDPDRLLFTGRVSLYRSLAAIPDAYDVVMPFMPPDVLEADELTHNVHGVEMARRGGRFEVLPWLRVPVPPSELYSANALTSWIMEAGLRGAVGIGLDDWSRVSAYDDVLEVVRRQLAEALRQPALFHEPPSPPAAVLYEPYAGGREFFNRAVYGYMEGFAVPDFAALAYNYRRGTIFGGLDYLCLEDLGQVSLDNYSVIFAPLCLHLPAPAAAVLRRYVQSGGALMGDLGLGMYEAGSWDPAAGPLAPLFGIAQATDMDARVGNLSVGNLHRKLPSVTLGLRTSGAFVPGQAQRLDGGTMSQRSFHGVASEMQGYTFQGPSCFVRLYTGTIPLASMSRRFDKKGRPLFLGLSANDAGLGLTVFGSYPIWSYWPPDDYAHAALHLDLIGRRARYRLLAPGLAAGQIELAGSEQAVYLYNRGARTSVNVLAGQADDRAYLGAVTTLSAAERDSSGRRTGLARLRLDLPAGGLAQAAALPLRVRPYQGQASVRVICYSAGLVSMQVGGNGSELRTGRSPGEAGPRFVGGEPTMIRFTVESGAYPIAPRSRHQVVKQEEGQQPQSLLLTADYAGRLDFSMTFRGGSLSIIPAAGSASASG